MATKHLLVQYADRAGTVNTSTVRVDRDKHSGLFYATHLGLWGCGKNARHIDGAIRNLVQDMAIIISIGKELEEQ